MAAPTKRVRKSRRVAEAALAASSKFKNPLLAEMYAYALTEHERGNKECLRFLQNLHSVPVSIEEFLDSEEFMGSTDLTVWPVVRQTIIDACKYWWKGLHGGAIKEVLLTGATGCVDFETEFLTRDGWKAIGEYTEGDEVLQYHHDGSATWVKPDEYIKRPVAYFYHFKNKTVNQMVTPGHRMIFRASSSGKIVERSAEQVAASHNERVGGYNQGKFISCYDIAGGTGLPYSDNEIRLMVAATSLGKQHSDSSDLVDCRIRSKGKAAELIDLLHKLNVPHTRALASTGVEQISFTAPGRLDNYNSWYVATRAQLKLIANEMLIWSGVEGKNRMYMPNSQIADFTQYVFTGLGQRATITLMKRNVEMRCEEYCVNLCASDSTGLLSTNKTDIPLIPIMAGHCYCFTLPTGMWVSRRGGKIVVTGNTGKSEISKVITAYHLHIIGCMKSVQAFYGLPSATSVVIPIQAAKPHVTKKVVYMPLRKYIEQMPWFIRNMRPQKLIESEMYFEKQNVRVVPGGSESDSILGEAIIAGIVDEINFMNVVENSKKAEVEGGRSGSYDQAQTTYDALTKRKKGRFISRGPHIGVFCISSSRRYRGDFTDRRQAYVEESGEPNVIIYDKAQYEARPAHLFCGETFQVALMGDVSGEIRILDGEEEVDPRHATIFDVPIEYLEDFKADPSGSTRDIIGRSTHAIRPFIRKRSIIQDMFDRGRDEGIESILHKDNVILGIEGMPRVKRDRYCMNPSKPRYVHIDLSNTGDRCGIAMVCYDGMCSKNRASGNVELLPDVTVELACTIEPDHASEIDIAEVRSWVKQLKDVYGYPIKAVTYDGWSSLESRQQWKKSGMKTGLVSVDRTSVPYKQLRDAMADGRLRCAPQDVLHTELSELEFDEKKDKIDHPPSGSKDCADAVCGAYHNLMTRAATWVGGSVADGDDPRMSGRVEGSDRFEDHSRPD